MDYSFKLTTHGRAALASCTANEAPPRLTRVAFGSGRISEGVDLADVHQLVKYVADGTIGERTHKDDRLSFAVQYENISHREISSVFYLAEFMVYIQDPETGKDTDLLYATLGDYIQTIPPYRSNYPVAVWTLPLTIILSSELGASIDAPAGLVTYQDLYEAVLEAGSAEVLSFTIPTSGWVKDGDGVRLDLAHRNITRDHIPFVSFSRDNQPAASACGLEPGVEAADGILRFWAAIPPAAPIPAEVSLFLPRGLTPVANTGGGAIPVATANSLGGIKGSDTINIDPDGTAHAKLGADSFVSEEEMEAAMKDVFGE